MKYSSSRFVADDGVPLFVHHWIPNESVSLRGVVHIAHGMAEHGARYAELAQVLTEQGFVVHANDHRGHGQTAQDDAALGTFARTAGWRRVVDDLSALIEAEQQEHPTLPMVLIGHSMGSFISQQFIEEHGDRLRAVVLSASDGKPDALATVGRYLARFERMRLGARGRSKIIQGLSFTEFNKQFRPNRTSFDWLSRDEAQVDRYIADPHCGFAVSVGLWCDLLDALPLISRPEARKKIPAGLPIYIVAGSRDPVGKNTRGLQELLEGYRAVGLQNVTHRFWPDARHEVFNETNRAEIVGEMMEWINARLR